MILKQLIKYTNAPALEATWVDENDVVIKCHAYSNGQMDMLRADLGADAVEHEALIAEIEATYVPTAAPSQAELDAIVSAKIEALWQAADKYTSSYISGVAIGILTIGVMQKKPKALAVSAWSSSVWTEYYVRKALVTSNSADNHDFSSFGPIPYSVPELQAEAGL
ncbi:hypothetical protein AcdelDRAFT_0903 [Acidovorax delafieldii 2AN]|uniref:Uncharacterized protein n=1 Tax=Acidovorax delafieldii 2AN TaxID=573060 RepID=C5T1X3_ACIDE|nr:hypothetical protein [Acidovorax delafieldii]EER61568.1 hypothetical protein AcdelDRAFT_0903 [Acidovorax delafieldii 2AN]